MAGLIASPSDRSTRNLRCAALLAWSLGLAALSLAPEVRVPGGLQGGDKLGHVAAYAVLALLLLRYLTFFLKNSAWLRFTAWLACFTYGLLLEALQWLMAAGRTWETGDLLANGCGALVVCVLFRHHRIRSSPHEQ